MRIFYFTIIVFCFSISNIFAQQNLFNIPSGDITNSKKIFYQHQLNVYNVKLESKAHLVYGLGKGWDIGANLVGKGVYFSPDWRLMHNDDPNKGALYPILMATIQKQFKISEHFDLNAGGQIGWNLSNEVENKELNYFSYIIGTYHFQKSSRIIAGFYQTNQMFVGNGNTFGLMAGYEIKLLKRWYLMGDWVSGNNDASVMVLGAMYNVTKRFQICAGWQIPNPNTPKPMGLVLEINLMGWDIY
jgi:hypothetical protein